MVDAKLIKALDLDEIALRISNLAHSEKAKKKILEIQLTNNVDDLILKIQEIQYLLDNKKINLQYVPESQLNFVKEAYNLNISFFCNLKSFLESSLSYCEDLKENKIFSFLKRYLPLKEINKEISLLIKNDKEINYEHPALKNLYYQMQNSKDDRYKMAKKLLNDYQDVAENNVSRDYEERICLSINYSAAIRLDGFILSASKSGKSALFEPRALIEKNNLYIQSKSLLEEAVIKEMRKLYNLLVIKKEELVALENDISEFLVLVAKARYALKNKFNKVKIAKDFNLIDAIHPLIENAIPISLKCKEDQRAIIISGPNAGGKSVSLKSIALTSLLIRYTGLTMASEKSSIPLYDKIFFDIGDNQNIMLSESTFSSHLQHLSLIVDQAKENDLILLDELCSGTSNEEAVALSKAIINTLLEKAKHIFVTTHFQELKLFALSTNNYKSVSTNFDEGEKRNTFSLIEDNIGQSHAISLAKKYFKKSLITSAISNLKSSDKKLFNIIKELNKSKNFYDQKIESLKKEEEQRRLKNAQIVELEKKLKKKLLKLEDERYKELLDLKEELKSKSQDKKIEEVNKEIEKSLKKHKKLVREVYQEKIDFNELKEGSYIYLKGGSTKLKVLSIDDKIKVQSNSFHLEIDKEDIAKIINEKEIEKVLISNIKIKEPKLNLDLRGYNREEAIKEIDKQIQRSLMHNLKSFSVIHGFGEGYLNMAIREYLAKNPIIEDYKYAKDDDGGQGKTYIYLKLSS